MELAQKDQLLEIGSRVRLGKPIICGRLSVSRDKSHPLRAMKFEQIFSLRCQTEQAESRCSPQTLKRMTFSTSLLNTKVMVEPDGIEPTTSCLQSRRSPS